jgi:hypothetical protein
MQRKRAFGWTGSIGSTIAGLLARENQGSWVELLPQNTELYVRAKSRDRVIKERAIRRRKLKWLWTRRKDISAMEL